MSNSVYQATTYTSLLVTNSTGGAGTAHTLIFRNGLLISVTP